jgi:octaprenyl-diphosphate synthase
MGSSTPSPGIAAAVAGYEPIAGDMVAVEQILSTTLNSDRPAVGHLIAHLQHFQGKRLRPALLLLTAQACGGVTDAHRTLAAVVEIIHTATLVHDDVLDKAAVRRHVETINAGWGNRTSILLGDYLFTHAFHLASSVDARACSLIGEATNRVCEGELEQNTERGNVDLSEEAYLDIIDGKTAELTSCCCRLGAQYASQSDAVVESMARYGRWLGVAFQVVDDLLDLVGEEKTTGKSLGTDLEQQKLTLPIIRLLQRSAPEPRSRLMQILSSPGNHKREQLRPLLAASDALVYASDRAKEFAAKSRAELACLPDSPSKEVLVSLTERVVHRSH